MRTEPSDMDRIIATAAAIRAGRYADCAALFLAGSRVRGEGTAHSDLDLVVVYPSLKRAYRESFRFDGYPVEAFVHDPETLEYFFVEVDRPAGIPALPRMVAEGVEIPEPSDFSRDLKKRAISLLEMGPPILDADDERQLRYYVTSLLDDLRDARSYEELIGTGSQFYEALAHYYFRSHGVWSARGKAIPRALWRADAALYKTYFEAFGDLFKSGDSRRAISLAEDLLRDAGGPLFAGYRSDAPEGWRRHREK